MSEQIPENDGLASLRFPFSDNVVVVISNFLIAKHRLNGLWIRGCSGDAFAIGKIYDVPIVGTAHPCFREGKPDYSSSPALCPSFSRAGNHP